MDEKERLDRLEWTMEKVIQSLAAFEENHLHQMTWTALFQTWTKGTGAFDSGTETKGNGDESD